MKEIYIHRFTFIVATTLYTTLYIPPYTFIVATTDKRPPFKKHPTRGLSHMREVHSFVATYTRRGLQKSPPAYDGGLHLQEGSFGSSHRWHLIRKKPLRVHRVATMRRLLTCTLYERSLLLSLLIVATAIHCNTLQHTQHTVTESTHRWHPIQKEAYFVTSYTEIVLQCGAVCCSVLQCFAVPKEASCTEEP